MLDYCKKLIIRHPHIFPNANNASNITADTAEQVLSNWENIKIKEKGYADAKEYIASTAKSLPALMRAEKIQKRLIKRKIIAPDLNDMLEKMDNSFADFRAKILNKSLDYESAGRLLYDIVSLTNEQNVNSEQALYIFSENLIKNMLNN